jgi:hypothetical protein
MRSARATAGDPLYDFTATDGVRHTIWRVSGGDRDELVRAFSRVPALSSPTAIIVRSAARARDAFRDRGRRGLRSATAPTTTRFSVWRFRTTRSGSSRTTES